MKPLATIYIAFVLRFINQADNNLFPVVVCDFKTRSSADQTMNAGLGYMLFTAIEVNIYVTLLALTSSFSKLSFILGPITYNVTKFFL